MSGPFGSSQWMYASGGFYGFEISNSLRFEDGDSALLARTPSSASNRDTWTWSAWVKRGNIGAAKGLFAAPEGTSGNTAYLDIIFTAADELAVSSYATLYRKTTRLFRDPSAWYHLVVAVDTTDGTADDRIKIYVNGVQETSFVTNNAKTQNEDTGINSAVVHEIGDGGNHFDGYMAEVNFVDGSQLTPSSFGETKNDIWIPKNTSGLTFGTNGFRLEFKQTGTGTASASTIGADTSGNDNHWTSTNLVASDVVPDSPTNNFCTLNPLRDRPGSAGFCTFAEGNLKSGNEASTHAYSTFTTGKSGKWYFEVGLTAHSGTNKGTVELAPTDDYGENATLHVGFSFNGNKNVDQSYGQSYGSAVSVGDIVGVAVDVDGSSINFYVNNSAQGAISHDFTDYIIYNAHASGSTMTSNFGQDSSFAGTETAQGNADENGIGDFYYAPPSGFLAMCTSNLPDPVETIDPAQGGSPQDYFNTLLRNGTGSGGSVTGVGFQPDWYWEKKRNASSNHYMVDSVRGVTKSIFPNLTNAEGTDTNSIESFDTDGFTWGSDDRAADENLVVWLWKAGTAFSNDASATGVGSIDSAGSVNTDVGFSIINYVGSGGNGTYAHGLGVAPEMILVKDRTDTANWAVYHSAIGTGKYLELNTSDAVTTDAVHFNPVTSTVIGVGIQGDGSITNTDTDNYIAYCFASVDGYSKIGSYTGNGNADGTFVYTGFRPAWVIFRKVPSENWHIKDNKTAPINVMRQVIDPNRNGAEVADANTDLDFLSNGFKMRASHGTSNAGSTEYFYMAFAEQSFKYSNAR